MNFHVTLSPTDSRTPDQVRAPVAKALALWGDWLKDTLDLRVVDSADEANVEIGFVPAGSLGHSELGSTSTHFTVLRKDITRATIQIVEGLTADQFVQAVAHECGHALGIAGHSDDRRDLMYPCAHYPAVVTDRDVNTLKIAYPNVDGVGASGELVASR